MLVKEIMHKPTFVDPDTPIKEVAALMGQLNIGSLIVGSSEKPDGIVTERDLLKKVVAKGLPFSKPVKQIMTSNLITIHMDEPIEKAEWMLNQCGFRRLPVIDDSGRVVGMLSARKLLFGFRIGYLKKKAFPETVTEHY